MRVQAMGFGWLLLPLLIVANTDVASTQITRYDAGIEFHKKKLKNDPEDFLTAIGLGELYTSRARLTGATADYREAERLYRHSLEIMPTHNIEAKVGLAASLSSQHRFKEADAVVKDALKESPETSILLAISGDVAFDLGDYDRVLGLYELYAKQKPGLDSWSRLAKIEMLRGDQEAAKKLWERCCAKPTGSDPEPSAWAWVMRGELPLSQGDFHEAMSYYEKALTIMPDFALALEHKAEITVIEKRTEEAIPLYRRAILSSRDPGLLIFLGDAFAKAGKKDSAAAAWKRGESEYRRLLNEGNVGYLRPLALYYLDHGIKPEKALELANKDLQIRKDYGAYLTLARAWLQKGAKTKALQTLKKTHPIAEHDPQFCYHAGEIQQANGNTTEAERLFRRATELCPAYEQIYVTKLAQKLSSLAK